MEESQLVEQYSLPLNGANRQLEMPLILASSIQGLNELNEAAMSLNQVSSLIMQNQSQISQIPLFEPNSLREVTDFSQRMQYAHMMSFPQQQMMSQSPQEIVWDPSNDFKISIPTQVYTKVPRSLKGGRSGQNGGSSPGIQIANSSVMVRDLYSNRFVSVSSLFPSFCMKCKPLHFLPKFLIISDSSKESLYNLRPNKISKYWGKIIQTLLLKSEPYGNILCDMLAWGNL